MKRRRVSRCKKILCKVCQCKQVPRKEETIFVPGEKLLDHGKLIDVMDCGGCGCQIVLKVRYREPVVDSFDLGPSVRGWDSLPVEKPPIPKVNQLKSHCI